MSYIEAIIRTERQFERLDEMRDYVNGLRILQAQAMTAFPQHLQVIETMLREASAEQDAARDAVEFEL